MWVLIFMSYANQYDMDRMINQQMMVKGAFVREVDCYDIAGSLALKIHKNEKYSFICKFER